MAWYKFLIVAEGEIEADSPHAAKMILRKATTTTRLAIKLKHIGAERVEVESEVMEVGNDDNKRHF